MKMTTQRIAGALALLACFGAPVMLAFSGAPALAQVEAPQTQATQARLAPTNAPQAQQAPITLQGAGPFYSLTLPAAIYGRAAFEDLRDLRVRNAANQPVPFAWLDGARTAMPAPVSHEAPLFAVAVAAASGSGSVADTDGSPIGLKLRTDGSLVLAAASPPISRAGTVASWIIDASKITGAIVQARVTLAPDALGVFAFTLEASDDLRQWKRVADDDQLVRLQQGIQTIERLAIELDRVHAHFLRLRWRDPSNAPSISAVQLDSIDEATPVAPIEWSTEVRATSCGVDYCDYVAPRHLPLQSLRIALAEPNTLASISIASLEPPGAVPRPRNALHVLRRGQAAARESRVQEEPLVDAVVIYRLSRPGGEAHSPALALDGAPYTTLRLRSAGAISVLGSTPPTLSFGSRPRSLVFLAQGRAPFALSWNAPGQAIPEHLAGPLALAQLIPGQRADQKLAADVATIALTTLPTSLPALATTPSAPPAVATNHKSWLWAALAAGLLLLGAMAWSLLRSLKSTA